MRSNVWRPSSKKAAASGRRNGATLASWGVSVVPRLLAAGLMQQGLLVDVAPGCVVPVQLHGHCWNLQSDVLDALTNAINHTATQSLTR